MTYTPFIWLLLLSALVAGWLAYYTGRYQDVPSVQSFRVLMTAIVAWATVQAVSISITDLPVRIALLNFIYILALTSVVIFLILALEYTGRRQWLTRQRVALLLVVPAIIMAFSFTSPWHQLWRYNFQIEWFDSIPALTADKGPVYWLYAAYMTLVSLASFGILITSFRHGTLYFRNTLLVTIGMIIPFLSGILFALDLTPVRGFDWTPISFIWMGVLYTWTILYGKLFDVTPIARNTLIENIDIIMIAVNTRGLIVDFNRAAQEAIASASLIIGANPSSLPLPWADVFRSHANPFINAAEVEIDSHFYELTISPIQNEQGHNLGRLFLFHNVTKQKISETGEREQRILSDALLDTAEVLNSSLNFDDVLDRILTNIGHVVPTDAANIALLNENGSLQFVRFHGYEEHKISESELRRVRFSLQSAPIFKRAYESGEPIIISDTRSHPDWIPTQSGEWIRSYAVMPIRVKNEVVGFLNLDSSTLGMYTQKHLHHLRSFAAQTAIAVENARLYTRAESEIMERRQAEEKIKQLFRAVEQSPASIIITDTAGDIEYVNPRFTQITGYSADEVAGKNPRLLKSGKTPSETYKSLWATITAGGEWRGELINRKKGGEIYYEYATISPILDANGSITHYLAVKENVTEQRKNELKLRLQNERLNTLYRITFDLLNRHNVEDVLEVILLRASDLLKSPFSLLAILEGDELVTKAATDEYAAMRNLRAPLKDARLSRQVIESHKTMTIDDYSNWADRMSIHDPFHLKAVTNVPIIINEEVMGVIALGRNDPNLPYSEDEIEIIESFAQLAALAIDNAQLLASARNELGKKVKVENDLRNANQVLHFQIEAIKVLQAELREQSIRDPLTGLYNRRYLDEALKQETARARREAYPIGFIMIDIDHFKDVNDIYGHSAGDKILQKLASLLLVNSRDGDIICRYGGEEFLAVLPRASKEDAFHAADKWRLIFQEMDTSTCGVKTNITVSFGISILLEKGLSAEEVIANADKALYEAKRNGRNRVEIWENVRGDKQSPA